MMLAALPAPLRSIPDWSPIGLEDPQSLIDVGIAAGGSCHDATRRNVVLSLVPLIIGIGGASHAPARAELVFRDRTQGRLLGVLQLTAAGTLRTAETPIACYAVESSRHQCLPSPLRAWQRLLQARRGPGHGGMQMTAADLRHLLVFYICPRPVLLVSAAAGDEENLFPMDLVGDVGEGRFTLALRNTSPSVATLVRSRRAALADVAVQDRGLAYALGAHHKLARIDWSTLSCQTRRSAHHGLRVPLQSPRVRDVDIFEVHRQGSHTVFLARVAHDERRADPPRLFHTSGIHHAWRHQQGTPPWLEVPA